MPEHAQHLITALFEELDYRREHYESTPRETGIQYGLSRAISIIERETTR